MGGSSKPADPKVTPFVEPPAPRNPIPNFFAGQQPMQAYQPDMGASQQAFGQQPIPAMGDAMLQDPAMGQIIPATDFPQTFSIPTRPAVPQGGEGMFGGGFPGMGQIGMRTQGDPGMAPSPYVKKDRLRAPRVNTNIRGA